MKKLPQTEHTPAIRTHFSDESAWKAICEAIIKPVGDFRAYVDFINDREYENLTPAQLITILPDELYHSCVFIIDNFALEHKENPILVVNISDDPSRTFRVIPSEAWAVENNLSIANMGFEEFADNVDQDGIYRGCP